MKKRNLFAELTEGFDALGNARAGKQTLRTHAALLIRLVEKYLHTVERLAAV